MIFHRYFVHNVTVTYSLRFNRCRYVFKAYALRPSRTGARRAWEEEPGQGRQVSRGCPDVTAVTYRGYLGPLLWTSDCCHQQKRNYFWKKKEGKEKSILEFKSSTVTGDRKTPVQRVRLDSGCISCNDFTVRHLVKRHDRASSPRTGS